jgi:hypothetical protein
MGELWRWNGHRTRSDRSQEYTAPRGLFPGSTRFLGDSAQERPVPGNDLLGTVCSWEG